MAKKKVNNEEGLTEAEIKRLRVQDIKLGDFVGHKLLDLGNEEIDGKITIKLHFNNGFSLIVSGQQLLIRKE